MSHAWPAGSCRIEKAGFPHRSSASTPASLTPSPRYRTLLGPAKEQSETWQAKPFSTDMYARTCDDEPGTRR